MERSGATTFKGNPLTLIGPELKPGDNAPDFSAIDTNLQPVNLASTGFVAGQGMELRPGLVIAIEPMVLAGTPEPRVLSAQWTVVSSDGSLTAHFEHSIAVTEGDPLILTVP